MKIRKTIFWLHLVVGMISGLLIAVMSVTGIFIVFEQEIIRYVDRNVSRIEVSAFNTEMLSVKEMIDAVSVAIPDFQVASIQQDKDVTKAWTLTNRQREILYLNPFSAEVKNTHSESVHHFLHMMEDWHRFIGMKGDHRFIGKMINGTANLMFFFLCLSGLYLWFPKKWIKRLFKQNLWFNKKARGNARDLNWHHVFGFWALPVLVVLVGTGVVISFGWAHDLVFILSGDKPPKYRDFRMMHVPPPEIEEPVSRERVVSYDDVFSAAKGAYPEWEAIAVRLSPFPKHDDLHQPFNVSVFRPALFSTMGYTPIYIDPYEGNVLKKTEWKDRSSGLRNRVWVRFLHTGEAFGLFGKIVAVLASMASLILVYTGFNLAYRRFIH